MKGLFLDDERNPEDVTWVQYPEGVEWEVVRSCGAFMGKMATKDYDVISFDHDLQDSHNGIECTGYDCIKMAVGDGYMDTEQVVLFHTMNPVGKENMEKFWNNFVKFTEED